jgi:hypothetical protein
MNIKKLKDDEKWFDTTHSLHREENKVTKRCVVCYSRGKRSESAWQCKQCGVSLRIEDYFEVYHTQQLFWDTSTGEFRLSILMHAKFQKKICIG